MLRFWCSLLWLFGVEVLDGARKSQTGKFPTLSTVPELTRYSLLCEGLGGLGTPFSFSKFKLHSLAKFLLVLPDSFSEWSGVWRWISSWGDWPKARDSFKRQTEQNGFDIVVLLTLIINFGLVLCSSCIGALCGCYHLYMLFISFNLMILVTQSLLKPSYCQFRFPRQLVVRSDGLLRRRPHQLIAVADTKQVLSNQHECHLFPPGSPSTNDPHVFAFSRFQRRGLPSSWLIFELFGKHNPNPSELSRARGPHTATLTRLSWCTIYV